MSAHRIAAVLAAAALAAPVRIYTDAAKRMGIAK